MAGMGVKWSTLTRESGSGKWPFLAAANRRRDWVKMMPLLEPNVEQMTKTGMIHAMTPSVR